MDLDFGFELNFYAIEFKLNFSAIPTGRGHRVTVMTLDFGSGDPGSNLREGKCPSGFGPGSSEMQLIRLHLKLEQYTYIALVSRTRAI